MSSTLAIVRLLLNTVTNVYFIYPVDGFVRGWGWAIFLSSISFSDVNPERSFPILVIPSITFAWLAIHDSLSLLSLSVNLLVNTQPPHIKEDTSPFPTEES